MSFSWPISFFLLLFASTTFAYPNVGDRVQWTGTINLSDGSQTPVHIIKEVIGYSEKTRRWTIQYNTKIGDHTLSRLAEEENLHSPAQFKTILATCTTQGGKIENLKTDVGTYQTCKLSTTTPEGIVEEKWWGDIPFGVVSKSTKEYNAKAIIPNPNSPLIEL